MCAWTYLGHHISHPSWVNTPVYWTFFGVPWLFTIERFHCTSIGSVEWQSTVPISIPITDDMWVRVIHRDGTSIKSAHVIIKDCKKSHGSTNHLEWSTMTDPSATVDCIIGHQIVLWSAKNMPAPLFWGCRSEWWTYDRKWEGPYYSPCILYWDPSWRCKLSFLLVLMIDWLCGINTHVNLLPSVIFPSCISVILFLSRGILFACLQQSQLPGVGSIRGIADLIGVCIIAKHVLVTLNSLIRKLHLHVSSSFSIPGSAIGIMINIPLLE